MNSVRIGFVFVVYRDYDGLERFLESAYPLDSNVQLVVVDNTEPAFACSEKLEALQLHFSDVKFVLAPRNLGYFGAANFATSQIAELSDLEYVAIANTDLRFDPSDFQQILAKSANEHGGVGVIAPRLTQVSGEPKAQLHYSIKPSVRHYRRLARIYSIYPLAVAHRLLADFKRSLGFARDGGSSPTHLFAPHGALMIFTREYFQRTAGFDYPGFLFCEEVFVGVECQEAELACVFAPDLTYSHENHGAMGSIPSKRIVSYLRESHELAVSMLTEND